jgi:cysteinyl-tRNA synthetase
MPRATEHIKEQIEIIKILEKKGFTYIIEGDGVYFDTSKFLNYGDFAGKKRLKERFSRIGENQLKKQPWDFALWKFSPKDQKRQMEWDSPWGVGFPGWHIECSAMSRKYLGQPFDIHTGGIDHITIHHQNEIAQSEAAFGKKLANYWLHSEFLNIGDKRMGKSEGNLMTLTDLKKLNFHPLSFRLLCLGTHYRKKMFFSLTLLEKAQKNLIDIINFYQKISNVLFIENPKKNNKSVLLSSISLIKNIKNALEDDLNVPKALGNFFSYIGKMQELFKKGVSQKDILTIKKTIERVDEVFALLPLQKDILIDKKLISLIKQRQKLRLAKQFEQADQIRKKLSQENIIIEDLPKLTLFYKKWPQ